MKVSRRFADEDLPRQTFALLGELKASNEIQPFRVIFTPEQETRAIKLLEQYADSISNQATLRKAQQLLREVRVRDITDRFLTDSERQNVSAVLAPPRTRKSRDWQLPRLSRRWLVALSAAVVVGFGVVVAGVVTSGNPESTPAVLHQVPGPVNDQPLDKTDLQKTEQLFGPWQTIAPSVQQANTNDPAVLLLQQDGGTLASKKWTVPFGMHTWQQQDSTDITGLSMLGSYVEITSSTQEKFVIHVGQPFIFEQTPDQVYSVDSGGHIWFATLAQAVALRHSLTNR